MAQVAAELINQSQVDIILATSTPDTTNPVSDQCESAQVPCVATICPWEIWFYPRGGSATWSSEPSIAPPNTPAAVPTLWNAT